jgi:hypothetical protein
MLNIDLYLTDLESLVSSLPNVVSQWETMEAESRAGFADQLMLLLVREREIMDTARAAGSPGSTVMVAQKIAVLNREVFAWGEALEHFMGIRAPEIIPAATTGHFGVSFDAPSVALARGVALPLAA